jgi:isoleucyl-tRNA synthetase
MIEEITFEMDRYQLQKAANRFEKFVEDLTNWYIRRSRRRFWKSSNDDDKFQAYQTLYHVLITFAKTAAPFIPFVTEEIYGNLRTPDMPESVHLCDFPETDPVSRDEYLEKQMDRTMSATSLGRYLRAQHSVKVRQPLKEAVIVVHDDETREMLRETSDIIMEELNVKQIRFQADEEGLVNRSIKANFKKLGPRLGREMKEAATKIASMKAGQIRNILDGKTEKLILSSGRELEIKEDEIVVQREEKEGISAATDSGITIALDTRIDENLMREGFAREFVSRIQNIRKEMKLEVSDRIKIIFKISDPVKIALANFKEYISNETLCLEIVEGEAENFISEEINGVDCLISVSKINN